MEAGARVLNLILMFRLRLIIFTFIIRMDITVNLMFAKISISGIHQYCWSSSSTNFELHQGRTHTLTLWKGFVFFYPVPEHKK